MTTPPPDDARSVDAGPADAGPGPLLVRPVRPDEYEAAGALVEEAYAAGGLLDNDRGYGAWVRDVPGRAPHVPVLVAERDGRLVGSVTVCPAGSRWTEMAGEGEVEFRFLGVAPEAQGTGVATALIDAVEDAARDLGAQRLVLCVIADNRAAEAVYDRLEFERAPDRDRRPVPEVHLRAWTRPVRPRP